MLHKGTAGTDERDRGTAAAPDRSGGDPVERISIQSLNITVVSIDSSDPGTRKELELAQKFFSGDVSAAAGIYYLGYNCNQISESQEEQLLENLQEYALCVAELQELEVA